MYRRTFLATAASTALLAAQESAAPRRAKIGIDLFSIRSSGWSPFEYLDYCAKWKADVVHFSEIRFLGNLETEHLKKVRAHAEKLGIALEVGMRSICPTSKAFDPKQGTAEEQIGRMALAAKTVGAPIVRAFLGTFADRATDGGIEAHIESSIKALKSAKSRLTDLGIKVAIENHAGDMQARELKTLIEGAGRDFVGACLDSGNPMWVLEDPHLTLETLAPYVLTSHVRDTHVYRVPDGAAVHWVRMGDGNIGIDRYVDRYMELCPGKPLTLEIIVMGPRNFPYLDSKFWPPYKNVPAWEFSRFVALAEKGTPRAQTPQVPRERAAEVEREDLEASFRWLDAHLRRPKA